MNYITYEEAREALKMGGECFFIIKVKAQRLR